MMMDELMNGEQCWDADGRGYEILPGYVLDDLRGQLEEAQDLKEQLYQMRNRAVAAESKNDEHWSRMLQEAQREDRRIIRNLETSIAGWRKRCFMAEQERDEARARLSAKEE